MKKVYLLLLCSCLFVGMVYAADQPQGWASVNAEGVNGTTGGAGGTVVTVATQSELENYANKNGAYIIQVSGRINISPMGKDIRVSANKTIIGLGDDAEINGGVLAVESTSNVIIRNLILADTVTDDWDGKDNDYDGIRIRRSHHVWVDHCTIRRHGDGAVDIVNGSRYVTISYCLFEAHNKTMLIGGSDSETFSVDNPHAVTLYYNWFNGTTQRHPRVRFGKVHVFNNYYSDMGKYGRDNGFTTYSGYSIGYGVNAKIISQHNYFENVSKPTDKYDNASNPAYITDEGSVFVNSGSFTQQTTGTSWVPTDEYQYEIMPAADVKAYVMANAGAGKMEEGTSSLDESVFSNTSRLILNHTNTGINIRMEIKSAAVYTFEVFDLNGRMVRVLSNSWKSAGNYEFLINKGNLPPGLYIIRLQSNNELQQAKMII